MATGIKRIADRLQWTNGRRGILGAGVSGNPMNIPGVTRMPLDFHFTSALVAGTLDILKLTFTQTAVVTSGYIKGIRCTMNSNVRTPGSFNAIKGIIDYKTSGSAHGDAACLSSELIPPNSSLARGSLTCVEAQVVPGASSSWGSAGPLSFMRCKLSGTATEWNTRGYFIDFQGLAEGSNKMIDNDGGDLASTGGIRCLMGTTPIWLLYTTTIPQ